MFVAHIVWAELVWIEPRHGCHVALLVTVVISHRCYPQMIPMHPGDGNNRGSCKLVTSLTNKQMISYILSDGRTANPPALCTPIAMSSAHPEQEAGVFQLGILQQDNKLDLKKEKINAWVSVLFNVYFKNILGHWHIVLPCTICDVNVEVNKFVNVCLLVLHLICP